ncbi:NAD-dependent epimerase/dehydratase family protein [candidate division KSB1 bacterium]|nr:NAD-dependent epimerase/dehydratase family protein [candidate division KSB1 bacterium]
MQKVLVTGASGFLGKHLINELLKNKFSIITIARKSSDVSYLKEKDVEIIWGDVQDEEILEQAVKECDYVIHAAATFGGSKDHFHKVNVLSTEKLLNLSEKYKIKRFVYISSISVYQHSEAKEDMIITEDTPYETDEFHSLYSWSKMEAEKAVKKYIKETKLPCTIVRPGCIYGPYGDLFPADTGMGFGVSRIIMIGNTNNSTPLSYVENVAYDSVKLMKLKPAAGEAFTLIEGQAISRKEYFNKLKTEVSGNISRIWVSLHFMKLAKFGLRLLFKIIGKEGNPPLSDLNLDFYAKTFKYSIDKINDIIDVSEKISLADSLERTMKWHREKRTATRTEGIEKNKVVLPSNKKIRVGIVGCGGISFVHLKKIKKLKIIKEIVLADPNVEALKEVAAQFKISKKYKDYKQMIDKEKLDVIHILTPPQFHAEIAVYAAEKKCHILVEKPMAVDAKQAEAMVQAARKNGVKICVMHNHLYDDVMLEARDIIAMGELGKITSVESWYGVSYADEAPDNPETDWKYRLPGSVYQDFLPHGLYVALDQLGDVQVSFAATKYAGTTPKVDTDELKIIVENKDKFGVINVSLSTEPRQQYMNIYGTAGTMTVDFLNQYVYLNNTAGPIPNSIGRIFSSHKFGKILKRCARKNFIRTFSGRYELFQGTERLISLFYRSILLDKPEPVPGEEGLKLMQIMDDVWENVTNHRDSSSA